MAGWYSYYDSDNDEPLNFNLFARKSFGFRGFSEEKERTLISIVKQIGATCDNFPKYVFTTVEHFNSLIDNSSALYNVAFIRDCVDANRCLNIERYRFGPKNIVKNVYRDFEPCCSNFHNGEEACPICDPMLKPEVAVIKRIKMKTSKAAVRKKKVTTKEVNVDPCTFANCRVDSKPHPKHPRKREVWEQWESRSLLDYIIVNQLFSWAKSPSLYKRMEAEGFLSHRTAESMRIHFRTHILPALDKFDLPKPILRRLKQIRRKVYPGREAIKIARMKVKVKNKRS